MEPTTFRQMRQQRFDEAWRLEAEACGFTQEYADAGRYAGDVAAGATAGLVRQLERELPGRDVAGELARLTDWMNEGAELGFELPPPVLSPEVRLRLLGRMTRPGGMGYVCRLLIWTDITARAFRRLERYNSPA